MFIKSNRLGRKTGIKQPYSKDNIKDGIAKLFLYFLSINCKKIKNCCKSFFVFFLLMPR